MLAGGGAYPAKISKTKWISSEDGGGQLIQLQTQVIDWMSWQWREGGNTYLRICVSGCLRDKKITKKSGNNGPPAPLPTEFSWFCEMKYLLEKEIHNKNEENTWKELNEIFLMVYGLPK
jgi:hypothetical protein